MMLRLTLRNLAAHKIRLVLTALSVILGVAFVAGTLIFTDTVSKGFDDLLGNFGKNTAVDIRGKKVISSDDDNEARTAIPVPQTVAESVAKVPGVAAVYGHVQGYTAIVDKDNKLIGGNGPPQIGINWVDDGDAQIETGKAPTGPTEVAIDTESAEKAGYKLGDQIKVAVEGALQNVRIVGLVDGDGNLGATITYWDTSTAQKLLLKPGQFSDVALKAGPGVSEQQLLDRIKPMLPSGLEAVTGQTLREESKSDIDSALTFLRTFLLAFAVVSIFVGSFNIFNTFSMLVGQRTRELALLRAVGASRGQVTRAVLGEAIAVGIVGSTLGLALGAGLASLLQTFFRSQGLDLKGGLAFTATPVIWAYAVGIIVTCIAAFFPARRASKTPPVAAMRDDVGIPQRSLRIRAIIGSVVGLIGAALMGIGLTGAGGASRALSLLGFGVGLVFLAAAMLAPILSKPVVKLLAGWYPSVFGVAGKMAKENPQRNPRRTAVTAVALMIGLSLVTTVNVLSSSIKASFTQIVDQQFGADYTVRVADGSAVGLDPAVSAAIKAVPGVTAATPFALGSFKVGGKTKNYASGEPAGLFKATNTELVSGNQDLGTDGIMLSEKQAENDKLKVGDTFQALFPDGGTQQIRVTGIYTDSEFLGPRILSEAAWKAHTPKALPFLLALKTTKTDSATKAALAQAIKPFPAVQLADQSDIKEGIQADLDGIVIFFTLMLALSVIIAVFGVINTIVLSVIERTRELGLLRAVGLSRRQTRRMIRLESVAIAVFGGVLGIGLGIAFGAAIQHSAGDNMKVLAIPYAFLAACLVFSATIGIMASLWPAWRAGRMDILKAIATN